jgi:hypothetical protein
MFLFAWAQVGWSRTRATSKLRRRLPPLAMPQPGVIASPRVDAVDWAAEHPGEARKLVAQILKKRGDDPGAAAAAYWPVPAVAKEDAVSRAARYPP